MKIDNRDIVTMREKYPTLKIIEHEKEYIFTGEFDLDHIYNDVRLTGKFNLEITVLGDSSLQIPVVKRYQIGLIKIILIGTMMGSCVWLLILS